MAIPTTDQMQLDEILSALGHPLRLAIVSVLSDNHQHRCGAIVTGVSKSTLTHHWRVLRDAGVISQRPSGRENLLSLRRTELNARFPGLLDAILQSLAADPLTGATIHPYLSAAGSISQ